MTLEKEKRVGSAQACASIIRRAQRALVICHADPDGDAIGSLLAMGWLLKGRGIDHVLACDSPIPSQWAFLPRSGPIISECGGAYDLAITVDCNAFDRLGKFCSMTTLQNIPIVNIDHHVTNSLFGQVNWVDSQAASTAEMVYELAAPLKVPLSQELSTCVLVGVATDTQVFRTPNTTPHTLEVALATVKAGASLADVVARTIDSRSFASMRLWAQAINRAVLSDGVVWAEVSRADILSIRADREAIRGLINFLLTAREARIAVVLTENSDGVIDVGFRSKPGVDVADAAARLGGGGHHQAAGCTLHGSMGDVRDRVASALLESLTEQGIPWAGFGRYT